VYVHGWKQGYRRTLPMADLMRQKLGGRPAPARASTRSEVAGVTDPPCVVLFTWPARRSHLISYGKARANAVVAGERLRQLVIELQQAECRVSVYGHSMGCRVILHALSTPQMVAHPVEAALLAAAAVSEDALSPDGQFPLSQVGAKQLTVFYSGADEALGGPYQAAEAWATSGANAKKALGLRGHVGEPQPVPRDGQRFEQVDMEHLPHRPYGYVADERVIQAASEALQLSAELVRHFSSLSSVSSADTLPEEATDEEGADFWVVSDSDLEPEPEPASEEGIPLFPLQEEAAVFKVCDVTKVTQADAKAALAACGGDTRQAIETLLASPPVSAPQDAVHQLCEVTGVLKADAAAALAACGGDMRQAVEKLLEPPCFPCWKQKPRMRTWPLRYIKLEGRSLNVYESPDNTHTQKPRGSSIADLIGCSFERTTMVWNGVTKPKIVLRRADLQGGGETSLCFDTAEVCDRFAEALEALGLVTAAVPTPQ
jgi:NACalpha-BTF3-like transcription factor/pimeloyl-ACP methyl ester carboxylesterase